MPRDYQLYMNDMMRSCEKIVKCTNHLTPETFVQEEVLYDAVLRNLMVIGEAAKNIPAEVKAQYPHIEWKKISGFRDIIIHAYFGIDDVIL